MNTQLENNQQANILSEKGVSKKVYNPPMLNILNVDQTQAKKNDNAPETPGNTGPVS